jgi:diadenosine tetraphosphate (Ap4A) HIT family hydrolase
MGEWPENWADLIRGVGCPMCEQGRPESDAFGVRIHQGRWSDSYLQRADVQRGYTIVIWRGRHVNEPTELSDDEAAGYWAEVLAVASALIAVYQPLKMNYETLGNSLPHLHTHLIPRFTEDPRPGQPFPLAAARPPGRIPEPRLLAEAADLRYRLRRAPGARLQPVLLLGDPHGIRAVAGPELVNRGRQVVADGSARVTVTVIVTARAPECRTTFVAPSRTVQASSASVFGASSQRPGLAPAC